MELAQEELDQPYTEADCERKYIQRLQDENAELRRKYEAAELQLDRLAWGRDQSPAELKEDYHLWVHYLHQSQKYEGYPTLEKARDAAQCWDARADIRGVSIHHVRTFRVETLGQRHPFDP